MCVIISSKGWGDNPQPLHIHYPAYVKHMGLEFITSTLFKVIDEKLFFLSVIKYGIDYKEWKGYQKRIEICGNGWGTYKHTCANVADIGIEYATARKAGVYFNVIDEELFFLSVIKYGITFNEAK